MSASSRSAHYLQRALHQPITSSPLVLWLRKLKRSALPNVELYRRSL